MAGSIAGAAIKNGATQLFGGTVTTHLSSANTSGVEIEDGAKGVIVTDNTFENIIRYGVLVQSHSDRNACENITIEGNIFKNCLSSFSATGSGVNKRQKDIVFANNMIENSRFLYGYTAPQLIIGSNTQEVSIVDNSIYTNSLPVRVSGGNEDLIIRGNLFQCNKTSERWRSGLLVRDAVTGFECINNRIKEFNVVGIDFMTSAVITNGLISGRYFWSELLYNRNGSELAGNCKH